MNFTFCVTFFLERVRVRKTNFLLLELKMIIWGRLSFPARSRLFWIPTHFITAHLDSRAYANKLSWVRNTYLEIFIQRHATWFVILGFMKLWELYMTRISYGLGKMSKKSYTDLENLSPSWTTRQYCGP